MKEDVKMSRCLEDVKLRRCFTDPHYWKNPALRRSREQKTATFIPLQSGQVKVSFIIFCKPCSRASLDLVALQSAVLLGATGAQAPKAGARRAEALVEVKHPNLGEAVANAGKLQPI